MTYTYGAAQRREALSPDEIAERRCDGLSLEDGMAFMNTYRTTVHALSLGLDTWPMWERALINDDSVSLAAQVEAAAALRGQLKEKGVTLCVH